MLPAHRLPAARIAHVNKRCPQTPMRPQVVNAFIVLMLSLPRESLDYPALLRGLLAGTNDPSDRVRSLAMEGLAIAARGLGEGAYRWQWMTAVFARSCLIERCLPFASA